MSLSTHRTIVCLGFGSALGISTWAPWYLNFFAPIVAYGSFMLYGDLRERWGKGER